MIEFDLKAIGQRIKQARLAENYSQRTLARDAGVSERNIRYVEQGVHMVNMETFVRLCMTIGCDMYVMLFGEDDD